MQKKNNQYKMLNAKCGITLITLVITVIVLLILAGTAISLVINQGSLIDSTKSASEQWNGAVASEKNTLDYYIDYIQNSKITITTQQVGSKVYISYTCPGFKKIEDASEDEKLEAILAAWKENGAPSDFTIENVREIYFENMEQNGTTLEEEMEYDIDYYNIQYTEIIETTVKLGNKEINVTSEGYFIAAEDGTYTIEANTANGRSGVDTYTTNYNGLTALMIEYGDNREMFYMIYYDSAAISTWEELVESEYNNIEDFSVGYNNLIWHTSGCAVSDNSRLVDKNSIIDPYRIIYVLLGVYE